MVEGDVRSGLELVARRGIEHLLQIVSDLATESLDILESMIGLQSGTGTNHALTPEGAGTDDKTVLRRSRVDGWKPHDKQQGGDKKCGARNGITLFSLKQGYKRQAKAEEA